MGRFVTVDLIDLFDLAIETHLTLLAVDDLPDDWRRDLCEGRYGLFSMLEVRAQLTPDHWMNIPF